MFQSAAPLDEFSSHSGSTDSHMLFFLIAFAAPIHICYFFRQPERRLTYVILLNSLFCMLFRTAAWHPANAQNRS